MGKAHRQQSPEEHGFWETVHRYAKTEGKVAETVGRRTGTLYHAAGEALGVIPYTLGKLIEGITGVARTLPASASWLANYLPRKIDETRHRGGKTVSLDQRTLGEMEGVVSTGLAQLLEEHARVDEARGVVELPLKDTLATLQYLNDLRVRYSKKSKPLSRYAAVFFLIGVFTFFLSVLSLDSAQVTGYTIMSSGISSSGFYSLIGLALLGISLFAFAHSERRHKKKQ